MGNLLDLFFGGGAWWFSVPALVGTAGYLVRLILSSLGGDHLDAGHAGDVVDGMHHDGGATVLSVQTLLTFAMGFGWGGLGAYRGAGWSPSIAVAVGIGSGVALVIILLLLLNATRRLQSTGNLAIDGFVGLEGEAYTDIPGPGGGRGQVRAVLGERERFLNAVAVADEIPARARVTIVRANADNTVTVRPS
jgi:hypothetical protein